MRLCFARSACPLPPTSSSDLRSARDTTGDENANDLDAGKPIAQYLGSGSKMSTCRKNVIENRDDPRCGFYQILVDGPMFEQKLWRM